MHRGNNNAHSLAKAQKYLNNLLLTPHEAIAELEHRQKDINLRKKINEYHNNDIPPYLSGEPALYLARHIATPNFETLRFIHLIGSLGYKVIISQDSRGLFVSQNLIKRALCKLPICKRITQKDDKVNELYEYNNIIDFQLSDGKPFEEITTTWNEPLMDFHQRLFGEFGIHDIYFPDDASWIDRHHRGNLAEHYKDLLSLFVTHGVFFENYNLDDEHEIEFVEEILKPACEHVENTFGYKPIIAQIFPTEMESYLFWISYPLKVQSAIIHSLNKVK